MTVPTTVLNVATHPQASGESLDLGLLVHAVDNSRLGRVQMQVDDVADLLHELRMGGELEPVLPVPGGLIDDQHASAVCQFRHRIIAGSVEANARMADRPCIDRVPMDAHQPLVGAEGMVGNGGVCTS